MITATVLLLLFFVSLFVGKALTALDNKLDSSITLSAVSGGIAMLVGFSLLVVAFWGLIGEFS